LPRSHPVSQAPLIVRAAHQRCRWTARSLECHGRKSCGCWNDLRRFTRLVSEGYFRYRLFHLRGATCQTNTKEGCSPRRRRSIGGLHWLPKKKRHRFCCRKLRFSLCARALSRHRDGVSCIAVPSSVYRPDSVVSDGADGLTELWSLLA
jgi:hypothetical protein